MAQHRQPSRDPLPWRFGLAIAITLFVVVGACLTITVVVIFNGDPTVTPAIVPASSR